MYRVLILLVGLSVVTGCTHGSIKGETINGKQVSCYLGESRMVLPDGRRVSKYQTLVRRVLMPEKSLVGEAVAAMIPNRPKGVHLIGMVVQEDGTFRFKEKKSGAEGQGKFEGKPWRWHAWRSTTQLAANVKVETRSTLLDGVLKTKKSIIGGNGKLKFTITDRLSEIGLKECERRFERVKREAFSDKVKRCQFACGKLKRCETKLGREKQELNHTYCKDTCVRGKQSRAFRCVMAVKGPVCPQLAECIRGRDID